MLAHLCFPPSRSRGRRYGEPSHPYRNIYQRDRDRVIHARAFRRLEHKTQVFSTPHSDHFRNRLTHTIEVSQIARTLAGALNLNEDLVEALALSHDIGHPPFGHAGEEVLDDRMRRYHDHFDHNLHALRIVESFEQRYAGFPGLNLTFEVREGIVKHSKDYDPARHADLAEYLLNLKPPLEAQLIDPADEITYHYADLDDGVDAGLVDIGEARKEVELFDRLMSEAEREFPNAAPRAVFNEGLRRLLDRLVSDLIKGTLQNVEESGVQTPEEVRQASQRLAGFTDETARASRTLRGLLFRDVYNSPLLALEREQTGEKVAELFDFFMSKPESLPAPYRSQAEQEPLHRVVCDYIAGMTDTFFLRRYSKLLVENPA